MAASGTLTLQALLERVNEASAGVARMRVVGDTSSTVNDITNDSRSVAAGTLFCCVRGEHHDGHDFAADSVARGAVALLVDHELTNVHVPQIVATDTRVAMGELASAFFAHPSRALTVVGVTGTNGKTTTSHMLGAMLRQSGRRTTVLGTLSGARTTPEAPELQRTLAKERDDGTAAVVMEVSSHALALQRVAGMQFAAGVFTNLGHDHLDFHGTHDAYFAAKASLF
ncbi:MAG: UDP-N-acetylmuramoyl-L-alanyl-D-glutamate--2,6-diaminopimelate ligase, partial [Actinobacteria bacterium]|nr:UDP-N-acetylmuramoyl-L-alanyl-D-glutamate--2,6-diaminopimelate ligase [Actinomycetota bacterium]